MQSSSAPHTMDQQPPTQPAAPGPYPRQLAIKPTAFRDFEIHPNDGGDNDNNTAPIYYCSVARMGINKPDILLQSGAKGGPVAGASHYRSSRSIICGVGADETSMIWTKLQHVGFLSGHFEFDWQGRKYALRRASGEEIGASALRSLVGLQFKVVDEATGRIVALFVSHSAVGRRRPATLKFVEGLEAEFETVVVLGVLSWKDKIRRTRARGAAAGGAGA
ncbi:hypothetical protein BDY17DRAFT_81036 [Neohortaea acidophila]|uniref:Tubby C-terminal-like domain-containing protein n=1 Tax=Neohortaea acidophila TaxID=245834 RepID=A0A6A6Q3M1_9PEZI|nr:uncharacterized protein BDY17DRAFT_81036 [Neohortaea acidophila]KAF2486546.1 hypothetical protein BDY17DRAFT_81036 [Neohortaea acidophila]